MPKSGDKSTTNNNLDLDESLIGDWESLVQSAETKKLATRNELENIYRQPWERDDSNLSKAIKELGKDNIDAQEAVINHVRSYVTKMINSPVYNIYFKKENYQERFFNERDENGNEITGTTYPGVLIFGTGVLENIKTGVKYSCRLVQIKAYRDNVKKIKILSDEDTVVLQASGRKNIGESKFTVVTVDDRCDEAQKYDGDIESVREYLKNNFDITPVSKVRERLSENDDDWRLVQGHISFGPMFQQGKKYAKLELTDLKTSIDEVEKKGSATNVQVFADKNLVLSVGAGRESKVQVLGSVRKSTDERYNSVSMWWPTMIIPLFKVPIEERAKPRTQQGDDDKADDLKDYLQKRMEQQSGKSEKPKEEEKTPEPEKNDEPNKEAPAEEEEEFVPDAEEDVSLEDGKKQCEDFGKFNPEDTECRNCVKDEEFKALSTSCKKLTEAK